MKKLLTLLILLSVQVVFSQIRISGTVYDENKEPLLGASVYLNNTTIGTSTDFEGFFELEIEEGIHDLIISFVGLQTFSYRLDTRKYSNPLKINLKSSNVLDEIVIRKKLPRSKRKAYLRKFRKLFLGESELGKSCKILNEDAIQFDVNLEDETFKITTTEPLRILHKDFGYIINYDLVYFRSTPESLNYFGYTRYEEIDDRNNIRDKWLQSRYDNYKGTKVHFLRAILQERIFEEGFRVDFVRRIPNPNVPTYDEIVAAEQFLRKNTGLQRNNYNRTASVESQIANAQNVLERAKLPTHITEVIKKNPKLFEYGYLHEDGRVYLEYQDYLRISYDKIPDENYKFRGENPKLLVSMMMLYENRVFIDPKGVFKKPYDVFLIGYWAFQRVGDLLPLNYKPDAEW